MLAPSLLLTENGTQKKKRHTYFGFPLFLFLLPPPFLLHRYFYLRNRRRPLFPPPPLLLFFAPKFETLEAKEEEEDDLHLWGIPSAGAGFYRMRGGIAPDQNIF